jgi:putative N-acetylmannosamine-6-phosphate epimerase
VFNIKKKGLAERDLKVFINPESKEMQKLRNETGFEVILIGKDGGVKKRKTELMTTEELFAIIDSMPMRQSEMRKH